MFEIIVTLCLMSDPTICRNVLVPGAPASSLNACTTRLQTRFATWRFDRGNYRLEGDPECRPRGDTMMFDEIGDGIFVQRAVISDPNPENRGNVSNITFVVGQSSIAVVDSGGSRLVGETLLRGIRVHSNLPISHLILTHMHPDHVLGASVFEDLGTTIVGHESLPRALADRSANYLESLEGLIGKTAFLGSKIVMPGLLVKDEDEIDLGDRILKLKAWPRAHTGTDLTVLDKNSRTLIAGDLVFHEHTPALDGSLRGWQDVLDEMIGFSVETVVPGHGGPVLSWPEAAQPLARYLKTVETDTRAEIDKGTPLGAAVENIARSEAKNWKLFEQFNPRNATVAYTELEWE